MTHKIGPFTTAVDDGELDLVPESPEIKIDGRTTGTIVGKDGRRELRVHCRTDVIMPLTGKAESIPKTPITPGKIIAFSGRGEVKIYNPNQVTVSLTLTEFMDSKELL